MISTRASPFVGARDLVRHHLHFFVHFVVAPAHESLDRIDGVLGVGHGLTLRDLPDQTLSALCKRNDGRRGAPAFLIGDDDRLPTFHHRNDGIGGAQIDSDNLAHVLTPSKDEG